MKTPWLLCLAGLLCAAPINARELKVCADPNNLPFSNEKLEGFENKIAGIVAEELGATITYVWHAQRRGNVRETLNAGLCDLVPGIGSSVETLSTTRPYYRSTYVVVTRPGKLPGLNSFDDARLQDLRIGVQLVGDDGANTPPSHALSKRGIIANVRGFPIYGDYASKTPQSPIVEAVAQGNIDVAFVWGPTAGYFAARAATPLQFTPIEPQSDGPALPMVFDVSMGVRRGDVQLKREVETALARHEAEIAAVLKSYGVPLISAQ